MTKTATPSANGRRHKRELDAASAKPPTVPLNVSGIPQELKDHQQWVCWRYERLKGKWTKIPINPITGGNADTTDSGTWGTFEQALAYHTRNPRKSDGIGFVFAADDPYLGINLDDCYDATTGGIDSWAMKFVADLDSYTEISPSQTGLKVWVKGEKPGDDCRKDYATGEVEMYEKDRFFTVTGATLDAAPRRIATRQEAIDRIYAEVFGTPEPEPEPEPEADNEQAEDVALGDNDIIALAMRAANGNKFTALWRGSASGYDDDPSRADAALCAILAFWCRRDAAQMDRLFRQSRLMRDKWDEKRGDSTYGKKEIAQAIQRCREVYKPSRPAGRITLDGEPLGPQSESAWEPPIPFAEFPRPEFPVECLPCWLADFATAAAEQTQTPPDLAGMLAIGIAGAGLARKYRVSPRPGWSEPTNIYTLTGLGPGNRKSAVFTLVLEPVQQLEQDLLDRERPRVAVAQTERRALEARLKHLEMRVAKSEDAEERMQLQRDARQLAKELAALPVAVLPQLFADDVTPEKLSSLLAEQGGRMLVASAEGGIFDILKGRYSESPNFDVFLKAHAGDPLRVGCMSRESEYVNQPALSLAMAVQPDVINGLASEASLRGRGFLARPLYSLPISTMGRRTVRPVAVPRATAAAYIRNMRRLWELPRGDPAVVLEFNADADEALSGLEQELEPRLGEGGDLESVADWAGKLAGAAVRLAGILHAAEAVGMGMQELPTEIGSNEVHAAIRIAKDYLLPHARAALGLMGADQRLEYAKRVAKRLPEFCESVNCVKGGTLLSKRNLHANVFGGSRRVEEVEGAVELLVKLNYLRPVQQDGNNRGVGRPHSQRYEVNPYLVKS